MNLRVLTLVRTVSEMTSMEKSRAVFRDSCVEYKQELMKSTLADFLCNIQPTFLRDFLPPKEEDTLFRTIWKRNLYFFFQLFVFFSRRKLAKGAHYF